MDDPTKSDPSDDSNKTQAPVAPAAPKLKEQAPAQSGRSLDSARDWEEKDEYWENYSREIELEKEILEMGGMEKIESGEVAVPAEVAKEMGIKPISNEQSPMGNITGFSIGGVAYDDNQLSAGLTKPTSSGLRWVVEWFIYQLLKTHYHVKRVKNKIMRTK